MEKEGLVKKIRETPNSVNLTFELTEKGHTIYESCKKEKSIKAIMSVLSKEELQELISILEKISNKGRKISDNIALRQR
jgi:DNA-binding MarR family transcriptional regulator